MKISPFARDFTPDAARDLAAVLKVVADPHRLRIIGMLATNGPLSGAEIQQALGDLTQPSVSHHLAKLGDAGLVEVLPHGTYRHRSLRADRMHELSQLINPWGQR